MEDRLRWPFNMIVSGPSQSGKTEFVKKLILGANDCILDPPEKIMFYYSEYQKGYEEIASKVEFVEGLPTSLPTGEVRTLIILDDLMNSAGNSKEISLLFTRGSHHRNMSVCLILQIFFHKGR